MQSANITYQLPIIEIKGKKKYAQVDVSFEVAETDAYTASYIAEQGSFRGLSNSLERKVEALNGSRKAMSLADITSTTKVYTV